jgi:hypothetical protein
MGSRNGIKQSLRPYGSMLIYMLVYGRIRYVGTMMAVTVSYDQDAMHVIGHDYVFIESGTWKL